jgi:hypothetical protein
MSTRATVHFQSNGKTEAIVYRHSDGYPEGLGEDLKLFFKEVQAQTKDTRFNDPAYLAAKFVVWQSDQYRRGLNRLDFLGVGVVLEDPGDIEYRYLLDCNGDVPGITIQQT